VGVLVACFGGVRLGFGVIAGNCVAVAQVSGVGVEVGAVMGRDEGELWHSQVIDTINPAGMSSHTFDNQLFIRFFLLKIPASAKRPAPLPARIGVVAISQCAVIALAV